MNWDQSMPSLKSAQVGLRWACAYHASDAAETGSA
jgi:hypothetical protein